MCDPIFTHKSYKIDQTLLDKTSHLIAFYISISSLSFRRQLVANPNKQYCMQLYEACYKLIRFPPGIALCCCRWTWHRTAWICLALPAPRQTWPSGGPHYRRTRCGSLCRTSSRSGSSEQQSGNGSGSSPVYQKLRIIDIITVCIQVRCMERNCKQRLKVRGRIERQCKRRLKVIKMYVLKN